jgi:serine protease Do
VVTVHDADAAKVYKKIIIEDGNGEEELRPFHPFGNGNPMQQGARKAMLGVLTDPSSQKAGALVKEVTPGSAAEKAGLRNGDVITKVNGQNIKDAQMLVMDVMPQHEAGDKVTINYERDGKEHKTEAKLMAAEPHMTMRSFRFNPDDMNGEMPNTLLRGFPFTAGDNMSAPPKLGVSAEDRADGEGVRVMAVKPGSAAASAGLHECDVITGLNRGNVNSVDELQMALRSMKGGDKVQLEYQRAGKPMAAEIMLPKAVKRKDL